MEKIIIIVGPTAVGKTDLSIQLAKKYDGEIINGDSMQVYQHLDIGTAKPTATERDGVPHHLLDFLPENESFSAAKFQEMARIKISDILSRGKLPIVVGGTGLYIEALIYDVSHGGEATPSPKFRKKCHELVSKIGNQGLWEKLASIDPESAERIHPNNVRRVIRALEVYEQTGEKFSKYQKERQQRKPLYDTLIIGLDTDRQLLYERINERVQLMMASGLEREVRTLYEKFSETAPAFKGIGYREFLPYFSREINLAEVMANIQKNSRHYAKRQLTWFRNRLPVDHWYNLIEQPTASKQLARDVTNFLEAGEL